MSRHHRIAIGLAALFALGLACRSSKKKSQKKKPAKTASRPPLKLSKKGAEGFAMKVSERRSKKVLPTI